MPFVAVLLVAAACDGSGSSGSSGSGSGGASPRATVATTGVPLPEGDEPVFVTPWGDDLLVGSRAPEGSASRPRLTVLEPGGGSRAVEVTPVSPTAFQAKWLVAAPRGSALDLVGAGPERRRWRRRPRLPEGVRASRRLRGCGRVLRPARNLRVQRGDETASRNHDGGHAEARAEGRQKQSIHSIANKDGDDRSRLMIAESHPRTYLPFGLP